jgi:RHS repeat-associated protein
VASIRDARNNTTQVAYDGFDRFNKITYPDTTFEQISSFDANGNTLTYVARSGSTVVNTWDVLNRLSTKAPSGQPTVTNTYDLAGRLIKTSKPVVAGDPSSGNTQFFFDSAGRAFKEQYPDGKTVVHVLDGNGNATKTTWPDAWFIDRTYDQMDRLANIKLNGSATNAVVFSYNQLSQRTGMTFSNGTSVVITPQLNEDVTGITHNLVGSSVSFTYGYNNVHEPLTQTVSDSLYMWHPSPAGTIAYGLADNVNKYPTVGGVAQTYDANKNLTGDGTWTFTFDTENHLLTANKTGTSASFVYDPMHRQSQKTVGTTKSRYVYSGWQMIAQYNGASGALQNRYVFGDDMDEPLIRVTSAGVLTFYHADKMGSIVGVSNASGASANKNKFSPFGEITTLGGTIFGFNGQRYDSETGLYYYKNRYYSPKLGRFLQTDPIGYDGGDLNLYTYVGNSPTVYTDPLGLEPSDGEKARAMLHEAAETFRKLGMGNDDFRFGKGGGGGAKAGSGTKTERGGPGRNKPNPRPAPGGGKECPDKGGKDTKNTKGTKGLAGQKPQPTNKPDPKSEKGLTKLIDKIEERLGRPLTEGERSDLRGNWNQHGPHWTKTWSNSVFGE